MAVFAQCALNDAGTLTLLSAHTACSSGTHTPSATWTKVIGSGDVRITAAGRGQPSSSSIALYVMSPAPADADYTVSATLYCASDGGKASLVARQTGTTTYYYAGFNKTLGRWEINKIVNGTTTQIGTTTARSGLAAGTSYALQFDLSGTTLTLRVDGTVAAAATDGAITAAGKAGIYAAGTGAPSNENQFYQWDLWSADDVVLGAGGGIGGGGGATGSTGRQLAAHRVLATIHGTAPIRAGGTTLPDVTPPVFLVTPAAINLTDTSAVITWQTDEFATTLVEYGASSAYGTTVNPSGLRTQHAVSLTGLTAATTYHYRVTTVDAAGNATQSEDATFATSATVDTTAPVVTVGPAASGITQAAATITWTTDEFSDSQVDYGLTSGYGTSTTLDATLVTQHTVALSGLSTGTLYHYRIKSRDAAGNLRTGTDQTFTTAGGADVTAPVVTAGPTAAPTSGGAIVTWTTDEASDSQVDYGTTSGYGTSSTLDAALVTSHSVTIVGLAASTLYHYRVKSRDASGNLRTGTDQTVTTTAPSNAITLGALELYPTYHSIGYRIPYSGDEDADATLALRFKRRSDATYRPAFDAWSARTGADRDFRGSVLNCDSGTVYDLELTVTDSAGGSGVILARATTWLDAIPAASSLTPTRYVDSAAGSDAAAGTSSGTAWRTLLKAIQSAPSGAVVRLAPGYYRGMTDQGSTTTRRVSPITLVAQYPAVGDYAGDGLFASPAIINAGNHAIVCSPYVAAPTGQPATDPHGVYQANAVGPWISETISATNGVAYQVWRWPASRGLSGLSSAALSQLAYLTSRDGIPQRVCTWQNTGAIVTSSPNMESPEGWMHMLRTNAWFRSGSYMQDTGAATSADPLVRGQKDLYLVWAGSGTPNDYWWEASIVSRPLLQLMGPNSRVSGLVLRVSHFGLILGHTSATVSADLPDQSLMVDCVVDHNLIANHFHGVTPSGYDGGGGTPRTPSRLTIEHNRFLDSNLRAPGPTFTSTPFVIPWNFVKDRLRLAQSLSYAVSKMGTYSETSAIRTNRGTRQIVCRRNLFDGMFNGFLSGSAEGTFSRELHAEVDLYQNYAQNLNDDFCEPENQCANWRVWGNRTRWTGPFFSLGPVSWGPYYVWGNSVWRHGDDGAADFYDPATEAASIDTGNGTSRPRMFVLPVGAFFKGGGITSSQPARAGFFIFNNTVWSDAATVDPLDKPTYYIGCIGIDGLASAMSNPHHFFWRNNIIMVSRRIFHWWTGAGALNQVDSDYNALAVLDANQGAYVLESVASYNSSSTTGANSIAALRSYFAAYPSRPAGYGNEAHTNHFGGVDYDLVAGGVALINGELTDPTNGDLTLKVGSVLRAAGVVVPNFERAGIDFSGAAPDLGYPG